MLPRNSADYRTVLWTLVPPALIALQYARPGLIPYLWWVSCYFALACGVIAHNHNHCPTFRDRRMNQAFANWISIFYGYPSFAWIPTHNLNHHKYLNTEGDATITWRFTNRHNALVAATYFFVSSYYQSYPIKDFLNKAKANNPALHRRVVTQYFIWGGSYVALLATAIALHGASKGLVRRPHDGRRSGVLFAVDDHAVQLRAARAHRFVVDAQSLAQLRQSDVELPAVQQRLSRGAPRESGCALDQAARAATRRSRRRSIRRSC